MSSKVYLIADLHFGHDNIATWRGFNSIEEHDNLIIENCNKVVSSSDTLWILGDVAMGHEDNIDKLGLMNGYKKLVLGNHDTRPTEHYLRYVHRVYGAHNLKNYILTHIPVHPHEFPRFSGNIHGHLHNEKIDDPRYFCVSAEQINYTPILLTDIITKMKEQII
jgi:calcineurin-like phosphoesterase family protein